MKTRQQVAAEALCLISANWRLVISRALLGGALAFGTVAGAAGSDSSAHLNSQPVQHQRAMVLPAIPTSTLEELKQQKFTTTKGRFQVGTGRTLTPAIALNRNSVAATDWTPQPDGWGRWSVQLTSTGALGLRLHLEQLALPRQARIIVYPVTQPDVAPAMITGEQVVALKDFWMETVWADSVVLACDVPPGIDISAVSFSVKELSHIYMLPATVPANTKVGTCHNDVTCFSNYVNDAAGVARISFVDGGNTFFCTGCLLANLGTNSDEFFLTANHCIPDQTLASTLEFFWLYQTATCNGTAPALSAVPHTSGGADLLAAADTNDFSFLRLRTAAPGGTFPLAWTPDPPASNEPVACIHHPGGDYKRICFGTEINSNPNFWAVQWSSGVTEPGSSGGPLLNSSHQVIGQLNGGFNGPGSSCSNPNAQDQFGRFDVTFNAVQPWLTGQSAPPTITSNGVTPPRGTYNGLFSDGSENPSVQSSGFITLTVTANGRFSGRLQMGNVRYALRGSFDENGNAQTSIARGFLHSVTLQMTGDPDSGGHHIVGTIDGGTWSAQMAADRAVFDAHSLAPEAGQYTMVIPGNSSGTPAGDSFAAITVDRAGRVHMNGMLADNTRIAQSAPISKDGVWPLYVPLYGGQGMLWSWITFSADDFSDLSGNVTWIKPKSFSSKFYKSGFDVSTPIIGSTFRRPARGGTVLNLGNAQLVLLAAGSGDAVTNSVTFSGNRTFGADGVLGFSPANGMFSGRLLDPSSGFPATVRGVALQKQNSGAGFFLGFRGTGEALITP